MKVILFENKNVDKLYPFSIMHSSWEMRCGALRLFEKAQAVFPNDEFAFIGRKDHLASFLKRFDIENDLSCDDDLLFLDGSLIVCESIAKEILKYILANKSDRLAFTLNGNPIAFYASNGLIEKIDEDFHLHFKNASNHSLSKPSALITYLHETLDHVGHEIGNDAQIMPDLKPCDPQIIRNSAAHLIEAGNILCGNNVKIMPGVVIDASEGVVIIDDNATIMPQSTLFGPLYIGKNAVVRTGAKIYHNCSFGEWCKIGGEIENSIIHAYSNKQHDGFLGHSYLGEWVNLGADTNTSNLKNTYSSIQIVLPDETVDTGKIFLGLLCGDHTKSSINAMFTTGTVAGICGILVREWFLPNSIGSFSWGGKQNSPKYKLKKAMETARIVMARRGKVLLPEEEVLMKMEYEN